MVFMDPIAQHAQNADVSFDGGDLDCGNGLLLLIRKHIDPLQRGGLLEIRSTEISVDEDLPAWCRMTKNELVSWTKIGKQRSFLVCKGALAERQTAQAVTQMQGPLMNVVQITIPKSLPAAAAVAPLRPLSKPLVDTLSQLNVGTLFLELCTPRAGEIEILKALPDRLRIGVGVCNQKRSEIEALEEIMRKGEQAIQIFGKERVLLNPDCGFATFADNPVSSERVAEAKLRVMAQAAATLRERHRV